MPFLPIVLPKTVARRAFSAAPIGASIRTPKIAFMYFFLFFFFFLFSF
jgi:hypothetical protein